MSKLLWQKGNETVDQNIMDFLAGDDVVLDRALLPYDVTATKVHVSGLVSIGILDRTEEHTIHVTLDQLLKDFAAGEFVLDNRFEDCHSAIEWYLVKELNELGKKVHTGRSRNDQVLVATRLYLKDSLQILRRDCLHIASECLKKAKECEFMAIPGYTHLQHGTVSSVGLWLAGFAEAFLDNAELAGATLEWLNCNPLGSAAGYGVNLALNRDLCTKELGFARTQLNTLYVQNSRGKFELQTLMAYSQALQDVRRFAWDLSLYTTAEFDFIHLPDEYTTGSSIMPNKRNPDVVELLRASVSSIQGSITEIQNLLSLPSGYHRDLQNTKRPLLHGVSKGQQAMSLLSKLVGDLRFNKDKMIAAIEPEMYATDIAMDLSRDGVPFRDAYKKAMTLDSSEMTPKSSLAARESQGGPGNLCLDLLEHRLLNLSEP